MMSYSTGDNRYQYGSNGYRSSLRQKQYILEPYPSHINQYPKYNPFFHGFRPIRPANCNQLFQERRTHVYNTPSMGYLGTSYQRERESSSPTSDIEFTIDIMNDERKTNNDTRNLTRSNGSSKKSLFRGLFDVLVIIALCILFALIYLISKPTERGFFCDDTSIQYPFKPDTVPMWLLALYGGAVPILIFLIVEFRIIQRCNCGSSSIGNGPEYRWLNCLKSAFETLILFALGAIACFFITEVGKRTVGRLRPYYITICNPVWSQIDCSKRLTTTTGSFFIPQYVTSHSCNTTASTRDIQEAKLSFPSGHASYSAYSFIFLFIYFEARLRCRNAKFVKPFLQCLCVSIAFFTSLSRIKDHKHHPTDVLAGAILGLSIAIFITLRTGKYLISIRNCTVANSETEKNVVRKEENAPVQTIDVNRNGTLHTNNSMELEPSREHSRQNVPFTMSQRRRNLANGTVYPDIRA